MGQILDTACTALQTVIVKKTPLNLDDSVYEPNPYLSQILWYIVQPVQVLAVVLGRVSVAVLLLRIIGFKVWQRYLLYFCLGTTVLSGLLFLTTTMAQCDVRYLLWHTNGGCMNDWDWVILTLAISSS